MLQDLVQSAQFLTNSSVYLESVTLKFLHVGDHKVTMIVESKIVSVLHHSGVITPMLLEILRTI